MLNQQFDEPVEAIPQLEIMQPVMQDHYWQSFTFSLQAQEDYQYLTVGNFRHDNQTIISTMARRGLLFYRSYSRSSCRQWSHYGYTFCVNTGSGRSE